MGNPTPTTQPPEPALERIRRYQTILNDFSRMVSDTGDLSALMQVACVQAARGIGIGHTKVLRYRPARGDLLIEAGVGWKPGVVGHVALGADIASPPGRALQARQPVRIDDLPNGQDFRYLSILREHGIVSLMNVPVSVDGVVWGVLEVDSAVPRHFSEDDVVFLCAMGNLLGLGLRDKLRERQSAETVSKAMGEVERHKMLMRELAHRDKNDFQMILSILLMQKNKQTDPQAERGFKHAMDRVAAISMAHDQLTMRPDRGTIDVAAYLTALCGNLGYRSEGITIATRLTSAELSHERAVSLGLITNELVTNALKYAFPDGTGTVQVEFTADPTTGQACLTVADNGVGMGPARPGSSGLQLVEGLVRQIGGTLERTSADTGTTFRVCFLLVR